MFKFGLEILVLLCFIASISHGAKIFFFFAGGSYSHKSSAWAWASELSNRGNEVTFLSSYEKKPSDEPKIRDIASEDLNRLMSRTYGIDRFSERNAGNQNAMIGSYNLMSTKVCQTILESNDPVLKPLVYNSTFDLVVINILFGECGFLLADHYKAKTISFDTTVTLPWYYDVYGFLPEASWIPDMVTKYRNFPLSYGERFFNAFQALSWYLDRCNNLYPHLEDLMRRSFNQENVPSYLKLERNASLVFINSHPAMDFAYSLPPMVKLIGGIQAWSPEKPIPQKYQNFMDAAGPNGVVLISFGSTIDLEKVPLHYQAIFFNLVRKYEDVQFLMKWNGSFPKGFEMELKNLMVTDWLPQRELLRHPNLRAFITHGGLNSLQEAPYYGVPLIVLPLFADQDYNAYRVEAQEVGFRLEIKGMTFEAMDGAMSIILNNLKYKKNMETKSRIFRDRPQSPLEKAVYWTEFVLRHDDMSSLKPMSAHLHWFQLRSLDVYLLCFAIGIILLLIVGFVCTKIIAFGRNFNCIKEKAKVKQS